MAKSVRKRTIETDFFGMPTDAPRMTGQKQKGNANEREAAKWLKDWTGVEFARTPMSGGLKWKNSAQVCGDVVCTDVKFDFIFSVETKHLQRIEMSRSFLRVNSKVFTIWEQAKRDADLAKKIPMLMLRENGMRKGVYWIFIPAWFDDYLEQVGLLPDIRGNRLPERGSEIGLIGFNSEEFKQATVYESLRQYAKAFLKL